MGSDELSRKIGWKTLAVLGVSYVVSGDFSGWSPGLVDPHGVPTCAAFLIGVCVVAAFYLILGLSLAELSSTVPKAGVFTFVEAAFGTPGATMACVAVCVEYTFCAAAVGSFTVAYIDRLLPFNLYPPATLAALYIACIGVQCCGVGEAMRVMLGVTSLAVVGLLVFLGVGFSQFSMAQFSAEMALAREAGPLALDVWRSLPWACWFFIALEGVPLAAEETVEPTRDVPRALGVSWCVLCVFALANTVILIGTIGGALAASSDSPLVEALAGTTPAWAKVVNLVGLAGLVASFFSIVYGSSRAVFALAHHHVIPHTLFGCVNKLQVPVVALVAPQIIGFTALFFVSADLLLRATVGAAGISYLFFLASFIKLRIRGTINNQPGGDSNPGQSGSKSQHHATAPTPFRVPGGLFLAGIGALGALLIITASSSGDGLYPSIAVAVVVAASGAVHTARTNGYWAVNDQKPASVCVGV